MNTKSKIPGQKADDAHTGEAQSAPRRRLVALRLSADLAQTVSHVAERCGFSCILHNNAETAANDIRATPPDCVLLTTDDIPFCAQLRHHEPLSHVPVIVLARAEDHSGAALALQSGASDLAALPVNPHELAFRLSRLAVSAASPGEIAQPLASSAPFCLVESELRLKRALKNMPVMVFAADQDGCILFFNPEFERVTGYSAEDIMKDPGALELLMPQEEDLLPVVEPGIPGSEEHQRWTFRAKDGRERTIIWSNISDRCPVPGWSKWGVGLDITEYARLERLREDVERMVRHDLRNPLGALVGLADLLLDDPALTPTQLEILRRIVLAGGRVTRIVESSLALHSMERGTFRLLAQRVDCAAMLRDLAHEFEGVARARGQVIRLLCDDTPLPLERVVNIQSSKALLESVVANLLKNAIEASADGSVITVTLHDASPLRIDVTNPGSIAPDMRPRLFRRYETNKPGGSGIGLYSARLVVTTLGGEIWCEPSPEGHTTFSLTLPSSSF